MKSFALRMSAMLRTIPPSRKYLLLALLLLTVFVTMFVTDIVYNVIPGIPVSPMMLATRIAMVVTMLSSVVMLVVSIEAHFALPSEG